MALPSMSALSDPDRRRLDKHVKDLEAHHNLTWETPAICFIESEALLDESRFISPPIATEMDYWAALHEVGHLVERVPEAPEYELRAWDWAIGAALIKPSSEAAPWIQTMLDSHLGSATQQDKRRIMRAMRSRLPTDTSPMQFKESCS